MHYSLISVKNIECLAWARHCPVIKTDKIPFPYAAHILEGGGGGWGVIETVNKIRKSTVCQMAPDAGGETKQRQGVLG